MLIPNINAKGLFRVKEPLNNLIRDDIRYRVKAIRTISEIIEDDIDVKGLIYIDQGLDEITYEEDLKIDIPIITLVSPSNEYFYIPANLLLSIPDVTGVLYTEKAIIISLGETPKGDTYEYIHEELKSLIISKLGIEPNIEEMSLSQDIIYSTEEDKVFKQKITALQNDNQTLVSRLKKALETIDGLKEKEKNLVEIINNLKNK